MMMKYKRCQGGNLHIEGDFLGTALNYSNNFLLLSSLIQIRRTSPLNGT